MNFLQESSPANLAFQNFYDKNQKIANVLPTFPESQTIQKRNDNLNEFRNRILEMDDEIKQLKILEREKLLFRQNNENRTHDSQQKSKIILKDESVCTTDTMLHEQKNRILELEHEFEQLKRNNINKRNNTSLNENSQENRNLNFENENINRKKYEFGKEFEDEVNQRIGNWSLKDPYQGPMMNLYFPFGSPGGGAPRRDDQGRIQTTFVGPQNINVNIEEKKRKILASQFLQESLQQDMLQQRLRRLQDKQQNREPNGNFTELISSFKVGRPKRDPLTGILVNNHLPSSDVTNMKLASPKPISPRSSTETVSIHNSDTLTYGMELAKAAKERQIMKHLDKLREQQECKQHADAWNNMWSPKEKYEPLKTNSTYSNITSNHRNFYQLPK